MPVLHESGSILSHGRRYWCTFDEMNPRYAALAAALLFSTGGVAIKSTALTSWQVAGLRSLVAAVVIAALLPECRRNWTWRSALVALAYSICLITFVIATKNTSAANAIFLQGTAPLYLVLLGPWLLKEPIKPGDWLSLALIAAGMVLVFWDNQTAQRLAPNPPLGNFLGAISGLAWACTVCGLRWLAKLRDKPRDKLEDKSEAANSMAPVLIGNLLALVFCAPGFFPIARIEVPDIWAILYMGIVQVGVAYWLLTRAMAKLPALEVSLLMMLEPALNPLWTWLVHSEIPTVSAMIGGILIIGATSVKSWLSRDSVVK